MTPKIRVPLACALALALAASALGAAGTATEERPAGLAALAGERLEYRVRWGMLGVARAALEVERAPEGAVLLRATVRTRGWIDPLYPVRDLVESTVEPAGLRPLRFFKRTREGHGKPVEVTVEFDHGSGVARYVEDGVPRPPLTLPGEFQDPLSCIYAYRMLAPGAGGEVALQVTDGKRLIPGVFREVGRERLRTPAGSFETVVVEPTIEGLGGVFRRSEKKTLRMWFTDDELRRLVRIYSEVAVGSFTMELTRFEDEGPGPPRSAKIAPATIRPTR